MAITPIFFILLFVSGVSPADQSRLRTFHPIEERMIQSEARAACRTNYTDLVTVYSDEDNAALTNLTNMAGFYFDGGWIGLTRNQSSDKWSNGADVTFSSLTGNCGSGSCCTAMKADGSWENLTCTEKRPFMCYKQGVTDLTPSYYFISENMSWSDAQSYCRRSYTDLVSIRDQNQNEAVKIAGLNSSTSFWIGLLRDDWEWTDGGRSAYRNWGSYQPQPASTSPSSPDCVQVRKGKWYSVPCSNPQYPLCYSSVSPADQSRLRTFPPIEKKMNQSEARAACRTNYTDLVTVYSDEDNAALTNLTNMTGFYSDGGWIGLTRNQSSDKWSNGADVTFSNLTGDCGSGPCCAAMKADGSWENLTCTEKRHFMCYKQGVTDLTPRYYFISENMNWSDAQSYCRRSYTDLVSIRDQNQNEAVKTAGLNSSTSFWIGLLRDDWEWTDGGRSAYRNWGSYQPRPASTSSDCVKLRKGKWYSVPCSNNQSALCYSTSIHISGERMTWESALDYCRGENRAGLLRIQSEADQKEVEHELRRRRVSGTFWVGLGQSQLFGFWIWTNWLGGRQPEPPLSHHCGTIDTDKGFKWRDKDCRSKFRVLCEVI